MSKEVFQVLTVDRFGEPELHQWFYSIEEADEHCKDLRSCFPDKEYWVELGSDYIPDRDKCKGCGSLEAETRYDAYGIYTGVYCEDCYNSDRYPYKKYRYDYEAYGERLEDDY